MLKESHHHLSDRYSQKTGSPFQSDRAYRQKRRANLWLYFSTAVTIFVAIALLFALPWEGGW